MHLVLVALSAPTPEAVAGTSSQILADILWANADPVDGLEHINVRAGPEPGSHTIGLYLLPRCPEPFTGTTADVAVRVLRLCQRAVQTAPALAGWTVALYQAPQHPDLDMSPNRRTP